MRLQVLCGSSIEYYIEIDAELLVFSVAPGVVDALHFWIDEEKSMPKGKNSWFVYWKLRQDRLRLFKRHWRLKAIGESEVG
jgi:hypothetical protein